MAKSKFEVKAQKELEEQGWLVDWKIRPSGLRMPRGYNVDYFGLFDLMAYRAGDPVRLISIKGTMGVPSKHRKALEDFWLPGGLQKEVWYYRKLKGYGNKFIPKKEII